MGLRKLKKGLASVYRSYLPGIGLKIYGSPEFRYI